MSSAAKAREMETNATSAMDTITLISIAMHENLRVCANFGSCTAEARRTQRSEFVSSSIPSSELCVLCGKIFHSSVAAYHYKIPPNLPLPKGGEIPLVCKEGPGEIF